MSTGTSVVDLDTTHDDRIQQAAEVVVAAFDGQEHGWRTLDAALEEVRESFGDGRLSLVALDAADRVIGWVGGVRQYGGHTWELHPLAVHPDAQGRGAGRALVAALEERVLALGGRNLWLTTDDGRGLTSLDGIDLYPAVLNRLQTLRDVGGHPVTFYQKCGFTITGVIPDAYAPGHHELVLAKRVGVSGRAVGSRL
jgi:aminoglycoside 6'-N-acetyltransferase I